VVILYDVELLLTLLIGGAIGVLVTVAHYERAAHRRQAYEQEIAEGREIYAALAMFRRIKPVHPSDEEGRRKAERLLGAPSGGAAGDGTP
jgi:type II secretory pathway component PulJ